MKIFIVLALVFIGLATCLEEREERQLEGGQQIVKHRFELDASKPHLVVIELGGRKILPVKILEKKIGEAEQEGSKLEDREKLEHRKEFEDHWQFKLDERSKAKLLTGKSETLLALKIVDYYEKNPETEFYRKCFAEKFKLGDSVDFVIDLAPSPSMDNVDKMLAESPIANYLQEFNRTASRAYFGAVEIFIESVTLDMKPEMTHTILYDHGRKYFIRGRRGDETFRKQEFRDLERNFATLWPSATNTTSESCFRHIVKNNLGHVTKMALWNRANGVPTVLAASRRSKPAYTIIITDGASGAKISDLTGDLSRTTLIDLGNRRFLKNNAMTWNEMKQLAGVYTFLSPQQLPMVVDTCRVLSCRFASHRE